MPDCSFRKPSCLARVIHTQLRRPYSFAPYSRVPPILTLLLMFLSFILFASVLAESTPVLTREVSLLSTQAFRTCSATGKLVITQCKFEIVLQSRNSKKVTVQYGFSTVFSNFQNLIHLKNKSGPVSQIQYRLLFTCSHPLAPLSPLARQSHLGHLPQLQSQVCSAARSFRAGTAPAETREPGTIIQDFHPCQLHEGTQCFGICCKAYVEVNQ